MIKSVDFIIECGTGGHWDEDGCSLLMKRIDNPSNDVVIPRIGETVQFMDKDSNKMVYLEYLVRNDTYCYVNDTDICIEIAIIPVGHSIKGH